MGIQLLIKLKAKVHPVKSIFDGLPSASSLSVISKNKLKNGLRFLKNGVK
jgi:hypothetical protein